MKKRIQILQITTTLTIIPYIYPIINLEILRSYFGSIKLKKNKKMPLNKYKSALRIWHSNYLYFCLFKWIEGNEEWIWLLYLSSKFNKVIDYQKYFFILIEIWKICLSWDFSTWIFQKRQKRTNSFSNFQSFLNRYSL